MCGESRPSLNSTTNIFRVGNPIDMRRVSTTSTRPTQEATTRLSPRPPVEGFIGPSVASSPRTCGALYGTRCAPTRYKFSGQSEPFPTFRSPFPSRSFSSYEWFSSTSIFFAVLRREKVASSASVARPARFQCCPSAATFLPSAVRSLPQDPRNSLQLPVRLASPSSSFLFARRPSRPTSIWTPTGG